MTETAWLAGVVLPATAWPEKTGSVSNTDRMVQMGRQAIDPPGNAKPDLWIIQQLAARIGSHAVPLHGSLPNERASSTWQRYSAVRSLACGYEGEHNGVAAVHEEMRQAMHAAIGGITWERLERESSITYPCLSAEDAGQAIVFVNRFPTVDGRVQLQATQFIPANESPDKEFPFVLITGRQLEHWHTGSMTRRSGVLDAIESVATVSMNQSDLTTLGIVAGDTVCVKSRRGQIQIQTRLDDGTPQGTVFIPFAYAESAANLLTNAALDPFGKIPEFKYCAVAIAALQS